MHFQTTRRKNEKKELRYHFCSKNHQKKYQIFFQNYTGFPSNRHWLAFKTTQVFVLRFFSKIHWFSFKNTQVFFNRFSPKKYEKRPKIPQRGPYFLTKLQTFGGKAGFCPFFGSLSFYFSVKIGSLFGKSIPVFGPTWKAHVGKFYLFPLENT